MDGLTDVKDAAQTGLAIVQLVSPSPAVALAAKILNTGLALAQQGTAVYDFLAASAARVTAAQASGRDLNDDDWSALDTVAAQKLLALKGYASVTEALLQTPSVPRQPQAAQGAQPQPA